MSVQKLFDEIDKRFEDMSLEELDQYDTDQQTRIDEVGIDKFIEELKDSYNVY